jgi:hypothetical protein
MAASRKIYREVADTIDVTRKVYLEQPAVQEATKLIADELARIFKADNPNFDRQRFLEACGL